MFFFMSVLELLIVEQTALSVISNRKLKNKIKM